MTSSNATNNKYNPGSLQDTYVDVLSYKPSIYYTFLFNAAAHDFTDEGKFVKQNPLAGWEHFDNLLVHKS